MSEVSERLPRSTIYLIDLGLLVVAIAWGASYSLMQIIVHAGVGVPLFLMLRFLLAIPFMALGARKSIFNIKKGEVVSGVFFGALLYVILTFETLGVKYTTASNAGFLIVVSVVLVPFFERILGGRKQHSAVFMAGGISIVGCGLLCFGKGGFSGANSGDALILLAALVRGYQIYMFGRKSPGEKFSLTNITLIELVVVASLAAINVLVFGGFEASQFDGLTAELWAYIVFLSVFATAFAFIMQLYAAKVSSSTRVGLILSLEPFFAALFAVLIVKDSFNIVQMVGGVMIVAAALLGRWAEEHRDALQKRSN